MMIGEIWHLRKKQENELINYAMERIYKKDISDLVAVEVKITKIKHFDLEMLVCYECIKSGYKSAMRSEAFLNCYYKMY